MKTNFGDSDYVWNIKTCFCKQKILITGKKGNRITI